MVNRINFFAKGLAYHECPLQTRPLCKYGQALTRIHQPDLKRHYPKNTLRFQVSGVSNYDRNF
jgi:hypothetical protein